MSVDVLSAGVDIDVVMDEPANHKSIHTNGPVKFPSQIYRGPVKSFGCNVNRCTAFFEVMVQVVTKESLI